MEEAERRKCSRLHDDDYLCGWWSGRYSDTGSIATPHKDQFYPNVDKQWKSRREIGEPFEPPPAWSRPDVVEV